MNVGRSLGASVPGTSIDLTYLVRLPDADERYVEVNLAGCFEGGIENGERLEKALDVIREECSRWIGAGKKVIVQ